MFFDQFLLGIKRGMNGKLPVIDDGKVVGIITSTDIVNLLAVCAEEDMRDMYFHSVAKIYANYSPYN